MVDFGLIDLSCCEEVDPGTVCRAADLWSICITHAFRFLTMDIRTHIIPAEALTIRTRTVLGRLTSASASLQFCSFFFKHQVSNVSHDLGRKI